MDLTKGEINKISGEISRLEIREDLILESKVELEKDVVNIDVTQIRRLYEKAKSLIPNIQKSFEETLLFHNETIKQRMDFIIKELPQIEQEIKMGKRQLSTLLIKEEKIAKLLNKSGAVDELQAIIKGLNEYHEKRGNFKEQKRLWEKSNKNLKTINDRLQKISYSIDDKDELIQTRISEFNKYFSDISNRLDGVSSLLSADNPEGIYKFKIGNIDGNPGTGGKKSQMASFDLAYIKFADELEIPCLHFVLQDQIENVHSNQITNLLTEIVDEINCQYVLPVLRDKLPTNIDISQFEVLSLSQDRKLFKID